MKARAIGFLIRAALAVLVASAALSAQFSSTLSGPVLGYVLDRNAGTVRPIRGILGSATIGGPVDSAPTVSQLLTLDARNVVVSAHSGSELIALHLDKELSSTPLAGFPANPFRSAASIRGGAAAFYYADAKQVRIVKGLPRDPSDAGMLQLDRPLTQLAVSDDGSLLVYSTREEEGEAVYAWTSGSGSPRFLATAASVSGLVMTPNGDAIVTDRGANEVFAIWDAAGGAVRKLLADSTDGVSGPTGVGVSSSSRVYVANAGAVMVFDASGRFFKSLRCNCAPSGVSLLRDSVFRLTDGVTQTIFLLDASSAQERILFVPPPLD